MYKQSKSSTMKCKIKCRFVCIIRFLLMRGFRKMNVNVKRVLAVLVIIALVFGWFVSLFGIGGINSVKDALKYGLDINGGVYVVMEAQTDATGEELAELMDQTRAVLDNRVNQMGVAESSVTIEGDKRLRVEIPGVDNAEEAIAAIGKTAKLNFILADGTIVVDGSNVLRLQPTEVITKFFLSSTVKVLHYLKKVQEELIIRMSLLPLMESKPIR